MPSNYEQLVRKLYQINIFHPAKMGLRNISALHAALGSPMYGIKSVHVAGTNGKGSVSFKMSKALQLAGYKTGLFVSPHISCFRERVQTNGQLMPEEDVVRILPHVFSVMEREGIPATFFEVVTAMAFTHFGEAGTDVAVIEAGLGGTLDATNIITPILSILTSVGLEHTRILGNTVEEIAREKSGIIKPGVPVVVGPHCPQHIFKEVALNKGSPFFVVTNLVPGPIASDDYDFDDENSHVARAALALLSQEGPLPEIAEASIATGVAQRPPCRFEVVQVAAPAAAAAATAAAPPPVTVVLDVAHNPQAIHLLFAKLRNTFTGRALRIVVGLSSDKNIDQCLSIMLRHTPADRIHPVAAAHPRAVPVEGLRAAIQRLSGIPAAEAAAARTAAATPASGGPAVAAAAAAAAADGAAAWDSETGARETKGSTFGAAADDSVRATVASAVALAAASAPPLLPGASLARSAPAGAAASAGEVVVVCGTVFIMGDARQELGFQEPQDSASIAAVAGAHLRAAQDNLEDALVMGGIRAADGVGG